MTRPVIGLCAAVERARWSVWDDEAVLLPRGYIDAIQRAGGLAIMLPPDPAPEEVLTLVDGVILAGGADYGERPDRDAFEIALGLAAMERDVPLLGVCRGMQLMNLARGGTLIEHLPDVLGHEDHRAVPGAFGDHYVRLLPDSLAARAAGAVSHPTKSHHHQGVDEIGEGFEVTGWATVDELVEAIEDPTRRFALGVQWHPEASGGEEIAALVEAARV
ncbi:gamma-glutamyl-gamma-aminobutyrate hydrolase family protein [Solirubrobacter sp. CPCC 204708]|uniref:Gamma-glutamyl-gamma-aminobutyrate hydrolase family protein n=1 Tax=Solirubrobacter deserti TaxID=2282478 RepID=A0ABT4RG71_9ACTN|nr:gamma-glutamyl-gamma-aminobutyrate hydrolase family protein [Solirubrobacter deserti]MBE2319714.1 gamma-glutamyl-gamma-aminobutyrate hydrolase family protein [Solirubrobacter deserti]MDA0137546.1 gamma-glutamyl-gamma-aminobutyrate hydrolase family protein [Solirubrobacter deserti]